jgi:hypothetical protein
VIYDLLCFICELITYKLLHFCNFLIPVPYGTGIRTTSFGAEAVLTLRLHQNDKAPATPKSWGSGSASLANMSKLLRYLISLFRIKSRIGSLRLRIHIMYITASTVVGLNFSLNKIILKSNEPKGTVPRDGVLTETIVVSLCLNNPPRIFFIIVKSLIKNVWRIKQADLI